MDVDLYIFVVMFFRIILESLSDNLKSLIMLKEYGAIMSSHHIKEFGIYLL